MQNIIKAGAVVDDDWLLLRPDVEGRLPAVRDDANVLVPLSDWLGAAQRWLDRSGRTGVWLAVDDEPADLRPWLDLLPLVAVDFPAFTDGRGYSVGRLLRERYSYAHELRAIGDIWHDHLRALWLVGFDTFEIKPGKPLEPCATALESFSEQYQTSYRQPLPLFRRSVTCV
jgi:uncharacterized protein (DUF934 family)